MDIKTICWEKYVRCFGDNSIRYEDIDWDNEKAYRCIYINGERVETAPLCATEKEARERLLHNLNDKEKWKSTNTIESLEKYTQGE